MDEFKNTRQENPVCVNKLVDMFSDQTDVIKIKNNLTLVDIKTSTNIFFCILFLYFIMYL